MPGWLRLILFAGCLIVVILLWIPPIPSEKDLPPPPLIAKPATAILVIFSVLAGAALPARRSRQSLVTLLLIATTLGAWVLARVLWNGWMP